VLNTSVVLKAAVKVALVLALLGVALSTLFSVWSHGLLVDGLLLPQVLISVPLIGLLCIVVSEITLMVVSVRNS
jgi:hypothetical protein